jgi:hypothetical protein
MPNPDQGNGAGDDADGARGLSLCMESRSAGGDTDSEQVAARRAKRSLAFGTRRRSNTRYLRLLQDGPPTAACVWLVVCGCPLAPTLGERDSRASTLGRCMGVAT